MRALTRVPNNEGNPEWLLATIGALPLAAKAFGMPQPPAGTKRLARIVPLVFQTAVAPELSPARLGSLARDEPGGEP